MATVNPDVTVGASGADEEKGADHYHSNGDSPPPLVDDVNANNNQGDPPDYPGNGVTGQVDDVGQEMTVIGTSLQVVTEPCVTFIAQDETTTDWAKSKYNYSLPLSTCISDLYAAFAKETRYVEGTFTLVWRKQGGEGAGEVEEDLFENSTATLYESGMEGEKRVYLLLRDKDGRQPEKVESQTASSNLSSSPGTKVTSTTLNNSQWNTSSGTYGNSSNYGNSSSNYGYSSGYQSYKSDTGYVGLVNQAMTCYLNSLLQTLYMTPEFRNALYDWQFSRGNGDEGTKSIPYQLQRLFIQLQMSEKRAVETTDVTKSFGWDGSEAWQQHDVQELCRVMFDALEKRFRKDSHHEPDLINHLYQGTLKDYVKCLECNYESAREDHFLDIPLVIKPFGSSKTYTSVEEAMGHFVQPETLSGDNQYRCEDCEKKCDAHKGLKFKSFPYLLTLQLKRFDFDYSTMHRIKLNDRMSFPRILDLNHFVAEEDMPPVPEDVEEQYHDFVVEQFDPRPPPYSYGRYGSSSYTVHNYPESSQNPSINISRDTSHDMVDDQTVADGNNEGDEATGQDEEEVASKELTVGQRLKKGPYVYELFSIMIHSGSAIGGHYYAYIKSFSDKRWYCFNDQSVTRLNQEDIEGTFGGGDSRSRGYYSSMYASSANAYMLMYRRVDRVRNREFITVSELPRHVVQQIEEDRRRQERERERREYERSLCKFRLFARHPESGEALERRIEVNQHWTYQETVAEAHKLLEFEAVLPVARCRLVKYDEYTETLDQSFEGIEGETFGQMVGGPRNYYSFELFLETRAEDEVFKPYNRGGLNLKILVVDLEAREVRSAVRMRGEQGWKVAELKEAIAEKFSLPVETMNLALETYQNEGRHLAMPTNLLKNENFFRKHSVFVCCDHDDYKKPFKESEMNKLIDSHVNSILLLITIPPPPQRRPGDGDSQAEKEEGDRKEGEDGRNEGEGQAGEGGEGQAGEGGEGQAGEGGEGQAGEGGEGQGGEGTSVDEPEPQGTAAEGADEGARAGGPDEKPPTDEVVKEEEEEEEVRSKLDGEVDLTKERPLQRTIEFRIDRRCTLQELKERLVDHVQQPSSNFKIYRLYSNNQEYEMFRVNDALTTVPNETRMVVRLGRALQPGEVRVRLSLLRMGEVEFFKPLMDSIITKGMTVRDFKKQLIQEAYNQGVEYPLKLDRIRLRKKTWRTAGTVYLDDQIFEKDIHVFANFEIYVEPLQGLEPMSCPTQMQVYLRRWHPSTYTVDLPHEIILDENGPDHLKSRIASASGIPMDSVEFAKAYGSFPCEISVLDIEEDMEWNPNVSTISSMPLSIYDDGAVLYYKDKKEKQMELTQEKRSEIQKQERIKSNSHSSSYTSYRYHAKEKALKIYTDDDDVPNDGTKES